MNRIAIIQDRHPDLTDNQCRSLLLGPYLKAQDDDLCPDHFSERMDYGAVAISHMTRTELSLRLRNFPFNGDHPLKCDCCDEIIQPEQD